jgi:hypothetical protein
VSGGEGEEPTSHRVMLGDGSQLGFRLEAALGGLPGFPPEELVGQVIDLDGPLVGRIRGRVISVDIVVDSDLGPGHWVVLGPVE